jgi:hypothetical protein
MAGWTNGATSPFSSRPRLLLFQSNLLSCIVIASSSTARGALLCRETHSLSLGNVKVSVLSKPPIIWALWAIVRRFA